MELCFQYDRFELLQQVVEDVDVQSDPAIVDRCVQFFTSHGEFEKAIDLLLKVGKVSLKVVITSDIVRYNQSLLRTRSCVWLMCQSTLQCPSAIVLLIALILVVNDLFIAL